MLKKIYEKVGLESELVGVRWPVCKGEQRLEVYDDQYYSLVEALELDDQ